MQLLNSYTLVWIYLFVLYSKIEMKKKRKKKYINKEKEKLKQ